MFSKITILKVKSSDVINNAWEGWLSVCQRAESHHKLEVWLFFSLKEPVGTCRPATVSASVSPSFPRNFSWISFSFFEPSVFLLWWKIRFKELYMASNRPQDYFTNSLPSYWLWIPWSTNSLPSNSCINTLIPCHPVLITFKIMTALQDVFVHDIS